MPLFVIDARTGATKKLTGEGQVSDFDVTSDAIVLVSDNLGAPPQLYMIDGAGPMRRVAAVGLAQMKDIEFSDFEQFNFSGWNGEKVYGYVVKPYGYQAGRKYPVAFLIHGGPHSNFGNYWSYRWNPQVWAGMGYAVVMIDYHGSSGYGENFARSILGHWGDRPLEDLKKGWQYVTSRYSFLDQDHACAVGGSYGGYMVSWMASQWPEPWKCLVNHGGIFDLRSMAWVSDVPDFTEAQYGGWSSNEARDRYNPALRASSWKTPMLIIHGERDFRAPVEQGIAAYNAARRAGAPTQLLLFPDEGHWITRPQNLARWYDLIENWINRWVK